MTEQMERMIERAINKHGEIFPLRNEEKISEDNFSSVPTEGGRPLLVFWFNLSDNSSDIITEFEEFE